MLVDMHAGMLVGISGRSDGGVFRRGGGSAARLAAPAFGVPPLLVLIKINGPPVHHILNHKKGNGECG